MIWSDRFEEEEPDSSEDEQESEDDHDDQAHDNVWSGSSGPWGAAWIGYLDRHHISESSLQRGDDHARQKAKKWKRTKHGLAWWTKKPKAAQK